MLSIIEQLENVQVNNSSLIAPDDKQFCESLFKKYHHHVGFWVDRLTAFRIAHAQYEVVKCTHGDDFYYVLENTYKIVNNWQDLNDGLTRSFIKRIEDYFKKTYQVEFASYTPMKDKNGMVPLENYTAIVNHIFDQIGTDLYQSGKEQIKATFQNLFNFPCYQPVLKGDKVSFPKFNVLHCSIRNNYRLSSDEKIKHLLSAITLFLYDRIKEPSAFIDWLDKWNDTIDFNIEYNLSDFTIQFYKNERVDLVFKERGLGKKFYDFYELASIVNTLNSK